MGNENELNELRERIGKLDTGTQVRLLELMLAAAAGPVFRPVSDEPDA